MGMGVGSFLNCIYISIGTIYFPFKTTKVCDFKALYRKTALRMNFDLKCTYTVGAKSPF